ncbi:MAG: LacI family DNA-binding transcriptional regulator [Limnochordales bacterium]|nr:LacI family DNA-binding transcriptional regulator [Limnochordales bacterium]
MPTILDVARLAQVSKSTASRVLNGFSGTPPEVRERVFAAARALGYEPDASARGLVRRKTETIGVVVAKVGDPFFAAFLRGAGDAAAEAGYSLTITSGEWAEEEVAYQRLIRQRRVDGLLFISGPVLSPKLRQQLSRSDLPVVMVDRDEEDWQLPIDRVNADNRAAIARAVAWLKSRGHTRIAFVGGPSNVPAAQRRLEGYRQGLRDCHLPYDASLELPGDFSPQAGIAALPRLLEVRPRPTAVIAANDLTAIGILRAAAEAGVRIPDDLSVLGVDDIDAAGWVNPPLTTLHQPCYEMGRRGVELLLSRIEEKALQTRANSRTGNPPTPEPGTPTEVLHEVLSMQLVVRESVAEIRGTHRREDDLPSGSCADAAGRMGGERR